MPSTVSSAINATAPTTMPAIAPPDRDADEPLEGKEEGVVDVMLDPLDEGDVVVDVSLDPLDDGDVVNGSKLEADAVVEDVCVAAVKASKLKVHELADGIAELKDEYVSFNTWTLMLVRGFWAELQQMLIWPAPEVQTSLFIYHQDAVSLPF
jgi:hypothetical protein